MIDDDKESDSNKLRANFHASCAGAWFSCSAHFLPSTFDERSEQPKKWAQARLIGLVAWWLVTKRRVLNMTVEKECCALVESLNKSVALKKKKNKSWREMSLAPIPFIIFGARYFQRRYHVLTTRAGVQVGTGWCWLELDIRRRSWLTWQATRAAVDGLRNKCWRQITESSEIYNSQ